MYIEMIDETGQVSEKLKEQGRAGRRASGRSRRASNVPAVRAERNRRTIATSGNLTGSHQLVYCGAQEVH